MAAPALGKLLIGFLLLKHMSKSGAAAPGVLSAQKTGPEALATLRQKKAVMSQTATRSKAETAFPSEWWSGPAPDGGGALIYLVWASDDPSSWAAFAVHKGTQLPTEMARGRGPQTAAVVAALDRRVQG